MDTWWKHYRRLEKTANRLETRDIPISNNNLVVKEEETPGGREGGVFRTGKVLTFATAWEKYLQIMIHKEISQGLITHRRRHLKRFGLFLCEQGINDVRAVTEKTIADFIQYAGSQWSPYLRFDTLVSVQNFFNRLYREDLLFINPVPKKLPLTKPPVSLCQVWTLEEVSKLLAIPFGRYRCGLRDRAMIELFYSSGIRLSELRRLQVAHVDFGNGLIFVNQGKGKKDRMIPLGRQAARAIRIYLRKQYPRLTNKSLLLFPNKLGKVMEINRIGKMLNKYVRLCGVKKRMTPHLLRHCMATHCLAAGASISIVQHLLGHSTPRITQIYTHLQPIDLKQSHQRFHPLDNNGQFKKLCTRAGTHDSGGKI